MTPERTAVVVTCFREGLLLREAMASIRAQTQRPDEIVVVNDGSPDSVTNEVCRDLERSGEARVLWRPVNGGTSAARNDVFRGTDCTIVVPLDADDLLPPTAVATIYRAFAAASDADFLCGSYLRTRPGTRRITRVPPASLDLRTMLGQRGWWPGSAWQLLGTTPLRRRLWEQVGGYTVELGNDDLHDVDFWIRALQTAGGYATTAEVLYVWRQRPGTNSAMVGPRSWGRIATRHFELYRRLGLEDRALALLLLDAKCRGDRTAIADRAAALRSRPITGSASPLAWLALLAPAPLVERLGGRRGPCRSRSGRHPRGGG
jgi:glycosyltransferase involved in cell wall biosynthesis